MPAFNIREMAKKYAWLIVGAGLAGSVFAREMTNKGKKVLVIDSRSHFGGNCYCENIAGVTTHKYGAHIFHTDSDIAWAYINKYLPGLNRKGIYTVQAKSGGEIYPLPFNMNTFARMWPGVCTPLQAQEKIREQSLCSDTSTLEGRAISQVGREIFEKLIKGYTEKQWGRPCSELPPEIIGRIPVRFTFDNNYYFCDKIAIPERGYNGLFENLLEGIEVRLCCDFLTHRELEEISDRVFYTGPIDKLFNEKYGKLDYRSLRFETEVLPLEQTQGCPVVNYCDHSVTYTRRIEHNQFAPSIKRKNLVVSYEYPVEYTENSEPYYPINNERNAEILGFYMEESKKLGGKFVFGGRLGKYRYFAMDDTIIEVLKTIDALQ